jgi:hypothetical protein
MTPGIGITKISHFTSAFIVQESLLDSITLLSCSHHKEERRGFYSNTSLSHRSSPCHACRHPQQAKPFPSLIYNTKSSPMCVCAPKSLIFFFNFDSFGLSPELCFCPLGVNSLNQEPEKEYLRALTHIHISVSHGESLLRRLRFLATGLSGLFALRPHCLTRNGCCSSRRALYRVRQFVSRSECFQYHKLTSPTTRARN